MKDIIDFFDFLSWRIYKEPAFNDVTWALCNANEKFKKLFLDFCFKEETPDMEIFEREKPSNGSKPDFYCEDKDKNQWILETKIDDRSELHFDQYRKEFPDAKCAFIANYDATADCDSKLNFSISTWVEFIAHLKNNVKKDDHLIVGYLKYLKNLIGYLEVENMDLRKTNSLYDFDAFLKSIIHEYSEKKLHLYNQSKSFFENKFGRNVYFENKPGKEIYFWIGIYFCDEKNKRPYLCLEFNIDQINGVPQKGKGTYFSKPDIYDDIVHYYLADEDYDILFSSKPETKEQKTVVLNFIKEVIESITS
jgi:hypothetical protein